MDDLILAPILALVVAAFFLMPKHPTPRAGFIVGAVLMMVGWAGVFAGIKLGDTWLLQSELIAAIWMTFCGTAAGILGPVFVSKALFAWFSGRATKR